MAYTALYRKWRPETFDDVVGQGHVTTTLKNEIQMGRVGHAFLFCGSRGTGKTSTARILSRAINCLSPENGNPCNKCENCRGILDGTILDITEIDAASNNGVDNIRELREEARFTGTTLKNKVYIVDEVHMLSGSAFNALLKILEEPPAHVRFILATTELHKVPATILSRCQRFDFKRIKTLDIEKQLQKILDADGFVSEARATRLIAEKADGSMRDALSLLDQCMAIGGKTFTYEDISEFLGAGQNELLYLLVQHIADGNVHEAIGTVNDYVDAGKNLSQLTDSFINYLRNLLLCKYVEDASVALDISEEEAESIMGLASRFSEERLVYMIKTVSDMSLQLRYSENLRTHFDIALIKIIKPIYEESIESLAARIGDIEEAVKRGISVVPASAPAAAKKPKAEPRKKEEPVPKKEDLSQSEMVDRVKRVLGDVKAELIKKNKLAINMALEAAQLGEQNGRLALLYKTNDDYLAYKALVSAEEMYVLKEIIKSYAGIDADIIIGETDNTVKVNKDDNLIALSKKLEE